MKFQFLLALVVFSTSSLSWSSSTSDAIKNLGSSQESVRRDALDRLARPENLKYSASVEPLLDFIKKEKSLVMKDKAAKILASHESAAGPSGLIKILETPSDKEAHEAAAYGLSQVDRPEAKTALLSSLKHNSARVRKLSVKGLASYVKNDKKVEDALFVSAQNDRDFITRENAVESLLLSGKKSVVNRLVSALSDSHIRGQAEIAKGLGKAKIHEALPAILKLLEHGPKKLQLNMVKAASNYEDSSVITPLTKVARSKSSDTIGREYALEHLAEMGDSSTRSLFVSILSDSSESTILKRYAAEGLAKTGNASDLILLIDHLGSADSRLRAKSLKSIQAILKKSPASLKALSDCLPQAEDKTVPGVSETKLILDILFFGGMPIYSSTSSNVSEVEQLSPETIKSLKDLVKTSLA